MKEDRKAVFNFQDLRVWEKAVDFAEDVIKITDKIKTPRKHFRLVEQLESASTSIAMNIAEGKGRQTTKEFIQFLYIARGSLFEVVTMLLIFEKTKWIEPDYVRVLEEKAEEINKMLNSLIKSMKSNKG